jgi:predicted membrane chloride channel (bestrophin family)
VWAFILSKLKLVTTDREVMEHPYPFQVFCFVLGFLLVFRTNFAYNRYIQGVQHVSQMTSKWGDAALQLLCFDTMAKPTEEDDRKKLRVEAAHLFSLMHAMALLKLRGDSNLENIHEYSSGEFASDCTSCQGFPQSWNGPLWQVIGSRASSFGLQSDLAEHHQANPVHVIGGIRKEEIRLLSQVDDKCFLCMQWIVDLVVLQDSLKYLDTAPPIVSRIFQFLSDGMLGYNHGRKISEVPFPYAWAQVIVSLLAIYTLSVGVLMAAWIDDPISVGFWTLVAVWSYVVLHEVNRDMEDPFLGCGPHDTLPLPVFQADFNNRLSSLAAHSRSSRLIGGLTNGLKSETGTDHAADCTQPLLNTGTPSSMAPESNSGSEILFVAADVHRSIV